MPVHVSARSHSPAAARPSVPAWPAGCWQATLLPSHWSRVHGLLSAVHAVPLAFLASDGQALLVPVQVSARSHSPAAARHSVPAWPAGCWQATLLPSHWSRVHGLPSSVHAVPLVFLASAGQAWPATPLQVSARSHSPAATRHTVPLAATTSAGQLLLTPSQVSAGSHTSPEPARHTKVLGCTASAGQVVLVPVHVSATSHTPEAARHTIPALPAACWQRLLLPLQMSVVHALPSSVHVVPFALNVQLAAQHEPAV